MAKNLPEGLTRKNIIDLREAIIKFFPEEILGHGYAGSTAKNWAIKDLHLSWDGPEPFRRYIKDLTGAGDVISANKVLEGWTPLAPESLSTNANRPTKESLEVFEGEEEKRSAAQTAAVDNAKRIVQTAIDKQKAIQATLKKDQKAYAKAERIVKAATPEEQKADKIVQDLKSQYETGKHQRQMVDDVTQVIEEKITPVLKSQMPVEDLKYYSKKTATDFVEAVNNPQAVERYTNEAAQTAILEHAATDTKVIPEGTRIAAGSVAAIRDSQIEMERAIIKAVFGEGFGKYLGPSPSEFIVTLYGKPTAGYTHTIDYTQLNSGYGQILENQMSFIQTVGEMTQGEAKSYLYGKIGQIVESGIARLPADSVIAGLYRNANVRNILSAATGGPITITVDTSFVTGFATKIPGGMGTINAFGNVFGVNVAVAPIPAAAVTAPAAEVGTTIITGAVPAAAPEAGAAIGGAVGTGAGITIGQVVIPIPVVGAAIGAAVTWVVGKVAKLIPWQKIKKNIVPVSAAMLIGGVIFRIPLLSVFGGTGLGTGILFGGSPFTRGFAARFFGGIGRFFGALGRAMVVSIGVPLLIIFLVIPVVTIIVIIIINAGAYVVPQGSDLANSTNPYIDVQKTASPDKAASPTSVTYTVTITAKKDALTGISIKPSCIVIKKDKSKVNCPPENIPSAPTSIAAGTPFSFTFTSDYDNKFSDALISNTINVSATSPSGGKVSASGAASVCFGDCPLDCFDLSDPSWGPVQDKKGILTRAASRLSGEYKDYAAKVCAAGPVKLCYTTSDPAPGSCDDTYAIHFHGACDITFNKCGLASEGNALFLLTHETTHHIQKTNGTYESKFIQRVPRSEWKICSYSRTDGDSSESMAEGDALYVGNPSWNGCVTSYARLYPKHYQFANSCMFSSSCP